MLGMKILEERKSKFNGNVRVVRSLGLGTYIQAGGITQSGGVVESIWKLTLRKVHKSPITNHKSLVLGLGGGTAAKPVRKHWPKAKITGVEIDPLMVELGKKYLGLKDVRIVIQDAYDYCLMPNAYDLIVVDLYVGDKFPEKFEGGRFSRLVYGLLAKNGIAVFNRLYFGEKRKEAVKFGNKLEKIFKKVEWFYPQVNLIFVCYNR